MEVALTFSWQTAILLGPMLIMLLTAWALTQPLRNRFANRTLALLLVVLANICTPWAIGFAQFYDRWPWLNFAPFSVPLAIAPLLYAYLHGLVKGYGPQRFWLHMLPASLQFGFLFVSFLLPLEIKGQWAGIISTPYDIFVSVGLLGGSIAYFIAGVRLLRRYREWLATNRSDDNRFAAAWIGRALTIMTALTAIWLSFEIRNQIEPLGYSGLMGLYIAIAIFGVVLAFEGWRHAALPFPHFEYEPLSQNRDDEPVEKDWSTAAQKWVAQVTSEKLYRDPELSITSLARLLGTNQTYLSRALNDGLGVNFSTFVNRLRSEEVARQLTQSPKVDILGAALDAGFNSKASFHRCFKQCFGVTPSVYRMQKSQIG